MSIKRQEDIWTCLHETLGSDILHNKSSEAYTNIIGWTGILMHRRPTYVPCFYALATPVIVVNPEEGVS